MGTVTKEMRNQILDNMSADDLQEAAFFRMPGERIRGELLDTFLVLKAILNDRTEKIDSAYSILEGARIACGKLEFITSVLTDSKILIQNSYIGECIIDNG